MNGKYLFLTVFASSLFANQLTYAADKAAEQRNIKSINAAFSECLQKVPKIKEFPDREALTKCIREKENKSTSPAVPVKIDEKPAVEKSTSPKQ